MITATHFERIVLFRVPFTDDIFEELLEESHFGVSGNIKGLIRIFSQRRHRRTNTGAPHHDNKGSAIFMNQGAGRRLN